MRCRCSPSQIQELINILSPEQKIAVSEMGFDCIFHLKVSTIPSPIVPLLLEAFSPVSFMFKAGEGKEFLLSKHDVRDMFMLPISDNSFEVAPTGRSKGSSEIDLKTYWRQQFNITDKKSPILVPKVYKKISEIKVVNDEFRKLVVWYIMAVFFAPTTYYGVDFDLVNAIENVSDINRQDWCDYVFKSLVKATMSLKDGKPRKYLGGCMLFLMLTYFQRFDFRGDKPDISLPLIGNWDNAKLEQRVKWELSAKHLGDAVLSNVSFPIYLNASTVNTSGMEPVKMLLQGASHSVHEDQDVTRQLAVNNEEDEEVTRQPAVNNEGHADKRTLVIDLPADVYADDDIARMSVDDVQKSILSLQRDCTIFGMRCQMWMKHIKEKMSVAAVGDRSENVAAHTGNDVEKSIPLEPKLQTSTQVLFGDPDLHAFLDNVDKYGEAVTSFLKSIPPYLSYTEINKRMEDVFKSKDDDVLDDCSMSVECNLSIDEDDVYKEYSTPVVCGVTNEQAVLKGVDMSDGIGDEVNKSLDKIVSSVCIYTDQHDVQTQTLSEDCIRDRSRNELDGSGLEEEKGLECIVYNRMRKEKILESDGVEAEVTGVDEFGQGGVINFWVEKNSSINGFNSPNSVVAAEIEIPNSFNVKVGASGSYSVVTTCYMLHSEDMISTMRVVPLNLGCTIDCGLYDPHMVVVSRFLMGSNVIAEQMLTLRKQVVDYVFLDGSIVSSW